MRFSSQKITRITLLSILITSIWVCSLYLANFVANNDLAQELVAQFGYLGVVAIAVVSGLNILVPVPAAAFVPIFTAAGLWMPLIIAALVLGTTIADAIGYYFGRWSKSFVEAHYPHTYTRIKVLDERHHNWILPVTFLYAALLPFPNEAIIIPLALLGFRFRTFIWPLVLGTIINQTALAYGANNIFELMFGLI